MGRLEIPALRSRGGIDRCLVRPGKGVLWSFELAPDCRLALCKCIYSATSVMYGMCKHTWRHSDEHSLNNCCG